MFTGIVEELGRVKKISREGNVTVLRIESGEVIKDIKIGDSVAVNGVCLTVVACGPAGLAFELMPETAKVTNLGKLRACDKVNLERSLKIGERLSGHFVTGHIDCVGIIRRKGYVGGNLSLEINVPAGFSGLMLSKGSVSVDGISLTLMSKRAGSLMVYIIPHTLKNTTLGFKGPSDKVNIEFDILAKKADVAL